VSVPCAGAPVADIASASPSPSEHLTAIAVPEAFLFTLTGATAEQAGAALVIVTVTGIASLSPDGPLAISVNASSPAVAPALTV
jgi:hypothetical protein